MIVKMIIHSKTIHLTSQTAALLKQFVPDRMNKLEGNSALSLSVITALFRGIVTMLVWQVVTNMVRLVTNLTCHVIYYNNSFLIITKSLDTVDVTEVCTIVILCSADETKMKSWQEVLVSSGSSAPPANAN